MARVSPEHLAARRRQILDGATACFARNGFHATSMQDVLKETGLSAGAVYRYFRSKEEMIAAIATDLLGTFGATFQELSGADRPLGPDEIVTLALERLVELWSERGVPPELIVQVWAEAARNEELAATMRAGIASVQDSWAAIARRYQRTGRMSADVPAHDVARTLMACAQGFMLQRALLGGAEPGMVRNGLRGLMSMETREPA